MEDPKLSGTSSHRTPSNEPEIINDPRFRAGRVIVQEGKEIEGAISIFASLLEATRTKYGETSLDAAIAYYEYGNALFRASAAAEVTRNEGASVPPPKPDTDVDLALEMMETAFSILDQNYEDGKNNSWMEDQRPRFLVGIGDVLSFQNKHADAADAYIRAIPLREAAVASANDKNTLDYLKKRRLLTETFVLVSEELLACPKGEDVVASTTLLVTGTECVEYIKGYYEKAKDELQEAVFLMGRIAAAGIDLQSEKEDICFLATMLMGVGNALADIDEEEEERKKVAAHISKKSKLL